MGIFSHGYRNTSRLIVLVQGFGDDLFTNGADVSQVFAKRNQCSNSRRCTKRTEPAAGSGIARLEYQKQDEVL